MIALRPIVAGEEVHINYQAGRPCPRSVLLCPWLSPPGETFTHPRDPRDWCVHVRCVQLQTPWSTELHGAELQSRESRAVTCSLNEVHKSLYMHGSWSGAGCKRGFVKAAFSDSPVPGALYAFPLCPLCDCAGRSQGL